MNRPTYNAGDPTISRPPTPDPRPLSTLALLQFVSYGLLWLLFHLPSTISGVPNGWFDEGTRYATWFARWIAPWLPEQTRTQGWAGVLALGFVCAAYLLALVVLWRRPPALNQRHLLLTTTLIALPLLALTRLLSSDVYSYAFFGRIPFIYGGNPFIDVPAQFPTDPLLPLVFWKTTASVYGPAWILVSLPITGIVRALGDGPWLYVLLYKVFGLVCHLASTGLILRLLHRLRPSIAMWGAIMYGWHPLALIEFAGNAHNDALMLLLMLAALWYAVAGRSRPALVLLVVAGLVKPVALALVPLYVLYLARQTPARWLQTIVLHGLLGLAVLVALYAPFWAGPATLRILVTAPPLTVIHYGPASWLVAKVEPRVCPPAGTREPAVVPGDPQPMTRHQCAEMVRTTIRNGSLGAFVLVYALLLLWPLRTIGQYVDRSAWILLAYTILGAVHFEPWYGTWLVAFAPLMGRPRWILALWGCSLLLFYPTLALPGRVLLAFAPLIVLALDEMRRKIAQRA